MKQYTAISKEIASFKGNSKLSDIYTYACLYSSIDYKTGESKYNQDTIEEKFEIPTRTFSDAIKRLSGYKIISIRTKFYYPNNTIIRKNYYSMKINFENYFLIWNDFFDIDASRELKGFLLLLKAHCLNGTNTYFAKKLYKGKPNKTELASLMGIDKQTLNKYLNQAIDKKLICIDGDKIILLNENFRLLINTEKRESEVRDIICMSSN